MIVDGQVVGTIDVESSTPSAFGDDDRRFLEQCRDDTRGLWAREG